MNLSAYDKMEINSKEPYVSVEYKKLYLYDIEYKKYYSFLKRYNSEDDTMQIFVLLTNDKNNNIKYHSVCKKSDKTITIDLSYIWFNCDLYKLKEMTNISFNKVDEQEDGDIYEIVI